MTIFRKVYKSAFIRNVNWFWEEGFDNIKMTKINTVGFLILGLAFTLLLTGFASAWGTTCANTQPSVEWNIVYNNATHQFVVGYRSTYCLQTDQIYAYLNCGEKLDYAMHAVDSNFCNANWANGVGGTGNNVWLYDCVGNSSKCCGSSSFDNCQANVNNDWSGKWDYKCHSNTVDIDYCTGNNVKSTNFVKTIIPPFLGAQTLPECTGNPLYTGKGYKTAWKYEAINPSDLENLMVASYSYFRGDDTHCERTRVTKLGIAELPDCEYEQSTGLFSGSCCSDSRFTGINCSGPVEPVCTINNTLISGDDYTETVTPNVSIRSSSSKIAGDTSLINDNNLSSFYGIGESQHHGGSASMNLTYDFSSPVNLASIKYTRSLATGGSSSDTERQIEKVIVWDNLGERVVYDRNVVYGGNSGTAAGGLLETKTIDGPFNGLTKVEINLYASSSGGSSDRLTRIRLYEVSINEGQPVTECCEDSDCGSVTVEKTCDMNESVTTTTTPKCSAEKCEFDTHVERETCAYGCANGECNPNPVINCSSNSQCGVNGYIGNKYCDENDSYQDYKTFTCNNAGTANSYCSNTVAKTKIQDCDYGCVGGLCLNPTPTTCCNNSQCGSNHFLNQLFCSNNNVYDKFVSFICNNAGTTNSFCVNSTSDVKVEDCSNGCLNGACLNPVINCSSNSQCGVNGYIGNKYCDENDSYQDYKTFTCNNAGTANSYCSNTVAKTKIQDCDYGCANGLCNNPLIICSNNSQCGTNHLLGQSFCSSNDVYDKLLIFTCNNAGTVLSYCSNSITDTKVEDCSNGCANGACKGSNGGSSKSCSGNRTAIEDINLYPVETSILTQDVLINQSSISLDVVKSSEGNSGGLFSLLLLVGIIVLIILILLSLLFLFRKA